MIDKSIKRILVINIFGIGDVLFTTPLLRNIKLTRPDALLGYVANRRSAPVLENNPHVDKLHIYERDHFASLYKRSKTGFLKEMRNALKEIKNMRYDLVIDLSLNPYASFLMWLVGIKRRTGFFYKNRSPFLSHKIPLSGYEDKHVIEYYCDLGRSLGVEFKSEEMEYYFSKSDRQWAQDFVEVHCRQKGLIIGLFPGGGASWGKDAVYKRWSTEKFAQLADKVIEKFSAEIILLGDISEKDLCEDVAQKMKGEPVMACGKTSPGRVAAVIDKCGLIVTNDGGPLHIAAALGVKTVSIFGPVDENVYGPYPKSKHRTATVNIACRPCYRQFRRADCKHISCLESLSSETVFIRVEELLSGNNKQSVSI